MPRGELIEYIAQFPEIVQIVSGGTVELTQNDDEDV